MGAGATVEGAGEGEAIVHAARISTRHVTDARANLGQWSDIVISLLLAVSGVESRTS